ncbi:XRE family transcriptional regulator [Paenibacillus sp. 28ISP30-2]|nr:XRE family transcriptional regulator [Paenibacillus sp. 28ISP30-2]
MPKRDGRSDVCSSDRKLGEMQLVQKTFCETYQIPPSRLSNLIHGTRKAKRHRKIVSQLLGIQDES